MHQTPGLLKKSPEVIKAIELRPVKSLPVQTLEIQSNRDTFNLVGIWFSVLFPHLPCWDQ